MSTQVQLTESLNNIASYIVPMATTIQISKELLEELKKRKILSFGGKISNQ